MPGQHKDADGEGFGDLHSRDTITSRLTRKVICKSNTASTLMAGLELLEIHIPGIKFDLKS